MSKRWGNVINPNDVVDKYGSDTLRMYEMFMGPLDQAKAWNESSVQGVRRFLERVYRFNNNKFAYSKEGELAVNRLINNIEKDILALKYNTAVSEFMKAFNVFEDKNVDLESWKKFLLVLAPFAPFLSEEMWQQHGEQYSVHNQKWPEFNEGLLQAEPITLAVQFKGKTRGEVSIDKNLTESEISEIVKKDERLAKYLAEGYNKVIYIKGRIINYV